MSDLLDLRDDIATLTDGVTTALDAVRSALQTNAATPAQLGALRADLTGYRGDIRSIRATLDTLAVGDYALYDDGELLLTLWTWERETRHALQVIEPKVRAAETVAIRLVSGTTRDTYTSRQGDTWQKLAARFLGDWKEWPRLVEANGGTPGAIASGTRIVIPPKR